MENKEIEFNDNDFRDSGLFSTCSYLNKDIKTQILNWYKTLNKEQKGFY